MTDSADPKITTSSTTCHLLSIINLAFSKSSGCFTSGEKVFECSFNPTLLVEDAEKTLRKLH